MYSDDMQHTLAPCPWRPWSEPAVVTTGESITTGESRFKESLGAVRTGKHVHCLSVQSGKTPWRRCEPDLCARFQRWMRHSSWERANIPHQVIKDLMQAAILSTFPRS